MSKQDERPSQSKGLWKNGKRKDYYNTMEIIVSNFRLDGSESGDVWGGGEEKLFFLCSCLERRGKPFPASLIKSKC